MIPLSAEDGKRIERKLDLILSAMGLSVDRRLAPVEIVEMAKSDVLKFKLKRDGLNHDSKASF